MSGFLNLLKPPGMTSHDVVDFVRRRSEKGLKVGHLGTLDPGAAGVLPIAVGKATRLIQYLPPARKAYVAEVTFGCTSDTWDVHGEVSPAGAPPAGLADALAPLLAAYRGTVMQVPPRVSALKVGGKRGHERARAGEEFEFQPRPAEYHEVRLTRVDGARAWLEVECGPGTYVRALAHELGQKLGCGALLSALIRTRSGPFLLESATTLEEPFQLLDPAFAFWQEAPFVEPGGRDGLYLRPDGRLALEREGKTLVEI